MNTLDISYFYAALSQPVVQWLLFPLLVIATVAALLWSGRIRQQVAINTLGLGILLPTVNLTLVGVGAFLLFNSSASFAASELFALL